MRGSRNLYFTHVYFGFDIWFPLTSNVGDWSLNPKCTYLGCLGPMHCEAHGRWHSMLTRHRSNLWRYFYQVRVSIRVWAALVWGVLGRSWGGFFACSNNCTVVACAKFRCDQWGMFWAGARQILVGFRVWSMYHWWDGRQSCEICTCTSILMTKISFHFLFLFWISVVRLLYCHVMLAINCTKLNWIGDHRWHRGEGYLQAQGVKSWLRK